MSPANEAILRDEITTRKIAASKKLAVVPPETAVTADSPIPFSAKQLWFDLINRERQTYKNSQRTVPEDPTAIGNAEDLRANEFPAAATGNVAPFASNPRGLQKQLALFRSRLTDSRYAFLFQPGSELTPSLEGDITSDLGRIVYEWVGTSTPITILDVSDVPSETVGTVVGTVLLLVYDTLFWARGTPISGREQPLLVMIDEAHRIVPEGMETAAHRALRRIAKEGRKYGIGLGLVTQRPTEIDQASLSQCGTLMALRLSNQSDRTIVSGAMPDDLGNLADMLPSLRTGEGVVVGEAMPIPSRVRFTKIDTPSLGNDPPIAQKWQLPHVDNSAQYDDAIDKWRRQSTSGGKGA